MKNLFKTGSQIFFLTILLSVFFSCNKDNSALNGT
jgi:hypothetical protein